MHVYCHHLTCAQRHSAHSAAVILVKVTNLTIFLLDLLKECGFVNKWVAMI